METPLEVISGHPAGECQKVFEEGGRSWTQLFCRQRKDQSGRGGAPRQRTCRRSGDAATLENARKAATTPVGPPTHGAIAARPYGAERGNVHREILVSPKEMPSIAKACTADIVRRKNQTIFIYCWSEASMLRR